MKPSDRAWLFLGGGVIAYEVLALDGELMSEAVDRYLEARPWLTRTVIATVALLLINVLPARFDPLAQIALVWKALD